MAIALHEANPGHHLQVNMFQQQKYMISVLNNGKYLCKSSFYLHLKPSADTENTSFFKLIRTGNPTVSGFSGASLTHSKIQEISLGRTKIFSTIPFSILHSNGRGKTIVFLSGILHLDLDDNDALVKF